MSLGGKLPGIVPILPTPFDAAGELDVAALAGLVDFAFRSGVSAVGTPAFGSEFYKLDGTERTRVLETVIAAAAGRVPVIAQCNHGAPRGAARLAAEAEKMGASAVNVALPRAFDSSPSQLIEFAQAVCAATSLPVIVQDWNRAGEPVGLGFVAELFRRCPNFCFLKLEEPGIGPLIRAVSRETGGAVGIFTGWGGLHALELVPAGVCGVMPGLGLADVFVQLWAAAQSGNQGRALILLEQISPYLQFSLQTFEQFHHAEKALLAARGLLPHAAVRPVTVQLNDDARAYLNLLIGRLRPVWTE